MMKSYQKLLKCLAITLFSVLLMGIVFVAVGSSETNTATVPVFSIRDIIDVQPAGSTSASETDAFNPNPPGEVVKLVFVHHSCGANWLDNGNGYLGWFLGASNYYVSDTYYGWGPGSIGSYTDIGHWWLWFRGPSSSTYLSALYTTTTQYASYTRPMADPGGENEVILFKSCYPNSNLQGNPNDPPTTGDNPLRGQAASSPYHTVGNAKGIYNDLLEYFQTRQDKLFVVITAPPRLESLTNPERAANARALNNWLVNDWLDDYPYHNVAVFDFYNVLTTNGGNADTNDYGLPTGNHHRVVTTTMPITIEHITDGDNDASPNVLEYPSGGGTNNHPSAAGNQKATAEFVPLLNVYYNCWKQGECLDTSDSISVTAVTDVAGIHLGETASYTLSVAASEGFTDPVILTLQGAPSDTITSFDPNPVTPPGTSQLYITTAASTVAGTYAMTVTGSSRILTDTSDLTLIVASAAPSFTLSISPPTCIAEPNQIVSYTAIVTGVNGFSQPVSLTVVGLPTGVGAAWSINPVTPDNSSTLALSIPGSPPLGGHPLYVVGVAETQIVVEDIELIIGYSFENYLPIILK
jgi:hypothetical protein